MATKPNRIQSKQVVALINGTPTRRIQTFDYASNFTTDSVYEMGNAGIVEEAVTLVETNITANSNEWGTTDPEAMFFGIFEQRNLGGGGLARAACAVSTLYIATRGAGGYWSAVSTGDWLQVIRFNSAATTNDSEYVKIVGKTTTASGVDRINLSPTYQLTAAPTAGDIVTIQYYTADDWLMTSNGWTAE